jgi:5,10-methylene-tetrahydrofolate dehydrogenase/methenyl tetrahydrofolate cyclohydrolase
MQHKQDMNSFFSHMFSAVQISVCAPLGAPPAAGWLQGCIELLERYQVPIAGKRAVVVGRSNIVGLPAALLLQNRDATVTIVHSRTPNAQQIAAGGGTCQTWVMACRWKRSL